MGNSLSMPHVSHEAESATVPFMRISLAAAFAILWLTTPEPARAADGFGGIWDANAAFAGGAAAGAMRLSTTDDKISGTSEPLDENQFFPLTVDGKTSGAEAELAFRYKGDVVGTVRVRLGSGGFSGAGVLYGVPVSLSATRGGTAARGGRTLDFEPTAYALQYSSRPAPVLRIRSGDRVRTTTVDNEGQDAAMAWKAMPGNPLTGPFYVEGAMPGDTLVVHLEQVALNRDSAKMYSGTLDRKAVQPGHVQTAAPGWSRDWVLDRARGTARLAKPGERLAAMELPTKPMIGSIGVAPPLNMALYAGDVWIHGGNLDYNRVSTGTTLYFPVFRAGAYLFLGDGHALQGDGEISGQGLETSLDVTFRVELIKGQGLGQLWSEDGDGVMVHGIDNTLDSALQAATSGMARWLKQTYSLNDSEAAAVMSAAIRYDIAEVVDSRPHVVARLPKTILAQIAPAQTGARQDLPKP